MFSFGSMSVRETDIHTLHATTYSRGDRSSPREARPKAEGRRHRLSRAASITEAVMSWCEVCVISVSLAHILPKLSALGRECLPLLLFLDVYMIFLHTECLRKKVECIWDINHKTDG